MSEQGKVELDEEIKRALLEAEEEARNDPTRFDHQTAMESLRRAIRKELSR